MKIIKSIYYALTITFLVNLHVPLQAHDITLNTFDFDNETRGKHEQRKVPRDISFIIADIKYDGDSLKILEFGEGTRSYFRGHDTLYGQGKIWDHLWEYLHQFHVPVWYIGKPLETEHTLRQIGTKMFSSIGGEFVKNVHELKKDHVFKKLCESDFMSSADRVGVVVLRHHTMPQVVINRFKENYPHFLVLDNACAPFVNNKYKTAQLFTETGLQDYKPLWHVYRKEYNAHLAQTIIQDFPNVDTFVIKPLNAANGWGVNIISKKHLDEQLKLLFTTPTDILRRNTDDAINYWAKDKNTQFLIEEYASSKTTTVRGKEFDGTMRMVFVLDYDNNTVNVTFLGCYWKLPCKALDEQGSLTERHKSKISSNRPSSAIISKKDSLHVQKILHNILPKLYMKMIEKTLG